MFSNGYELDQKVSSFMAGVYGWMSCALALTAGAAYYVASTPSIFMYLYTHSALIVGLFIFQIGLVIALSGFINRMSFVTALVLFLLYAASLGVTLSSIFFVYTQSSILSTFLTTALTFGAMSLYGYFTKADLTSIGTMSLMVLVGLVIGMFVNMFLKSEQFDYILSGIGVVVFTLLTAYDTQKIKEIGRHMLADREAAGKVTLIGALALYLDFVNLFLFLLRFMGQRRDQ
ncbi:MAG TPA: Bax inhibitor-1/YccA family protein [Candidatus Babeliales bacterium]|jgi:FtsH-binding integral membrane protein|nr:Bax inhibitor-1/YccA family protein [Candidatus Babeliales bacterium]